MNYLIEGPRNVGKSFLIRKLSEKKDLKILKTNVIDIFDKINNPYILIGKDLPILSMLGGPQFDSILFDRGFISTLAYGEFFQRYSQTEMDVFTQYINSEKLNLTLILISGENPNIVRKIDSFDFLDSRYQEQLKYFDKYFDKITCCKKVKFINYFDENSIDRFINLFEGEDK